MPWPKVLILGLTLLAVGSIAGYQRGYPLRATAMGPAWWPVAISPHPLERSHSTTA